MSPRACIELFHLVFLRALVAKGEDKGLISLKGGCNLRFFFNSVRYSEDIDLDVVVIGKETLKNKVDRLLKAPAVTAPLKVRGIELVDVSAPKQTATTQRWKAGLRAPGMSVPVRTKIEFSRRLGGERLAGTAFEATTPETLRPYGLSPFLATHYATPVAIEQKIRALAGRTEPQARDVFDLDLLLARTEAATVEADEALRSLLPAAIDAAIGISFDDYVSKVIAYLDPAHVELYESRDTWDAMQGAVVARLEALS